MYGQDKDRGNALNTDQCRQNGTDDAKGNPVGSPLPGRLSHEA